MAIIQEKKIQIWLYIKYERILRKRSFYVFGLVTGTYKIVFFIKIKLRTHAIEGSVTFYGMTIQEETIVINEFGAFVP